MPRMLGGWSFSDSACAFEDMAVHRVDNGTPMSREFAPRPAGASPQFLVFGTQASDSAPLQNRPTCPMADRPWARTPGQHSAPGPH